MIGRKYSSGLRPMILAAARTEPQSIDVTDLMELSDDDVACVLQLVGSTHAAQLAIQVDEWHRSIYTAERRRELAAAEESTRRRREAQRARRQREREARVLERERLEREARRRNRVIRGRYEQFHPSPIVTYSYPFHSDGCWRVRATPTLEEYDVM